jgi:diguanylate cyclase (GGDEF)-like protein
MSSIPQPTPPGAAPRTLRFGAQLIGLFGGLAFVLVVALSWPLGRMLTEQALRERGQALHTTASGVALMLAEGLRERLREVELMAEASQAHHIGLQPARWQREIAWLREGRPHYAWIGVADASGTVLAAHGDLLLGQDVSQRPWFRQALARPFLGDLHPAKLLSQLLPRPASGEPLRFLDLAAPLRDEQGRAIGVLGVHINWDWAQHVIDGVRSREAYGDGVRVYIVDREGRVIHHPAGSRRGGQGVLPAVPRPQPALLAWLDAEPELAVGVPLPRQSGLPDLGWTVVATQPEAPVLAHVQAVRRTVLSWGALAGICAMVLAALAARRFSQPLGRIQRAAEQISDGDRNVDIAAVVGRQRTREMAGLAQSLATMTRSLMARELEVRGMNAQLESRVAERTEELAAANRHLAELAHQDGLTGLHNRRFADQMLATQLALNRRRGGALGVLLADVDHFKGVNDRHGHAVGDAVLQAVSASLRATVRESDVVARWGGEEFLVILPECDHAGLLQVAETLRAAVASLNVPVAGRCTVSIGGAVAHDGAQTAAGLLHAADEALYAAKRDGRNRVVLAPLAQPSATAPLLAEPQGRHDALPPPQPQQPPDPRQPGQRQEPHDAAPPLQPAV